MKLEVGKFRLRSIYSLKSISSAKGYLIQPHHQRQKYLGPDDLVLQLLTPKFAKYLAEEA